MTPGRIFLSYRRADTRHMAGRLFDRLSDEYGEGTIFMDVDSIEPGLDYTEVVDRVIGNCDALIAVIGQGWLREADNLGRQRIADPTDLMSLEIRAALDRNIRVIPVLVDGATMPRREELPLSLAALARRHSIRIDHETFRQDIVPLINVLGRTVRRTPAEYLQGNTENLVCPPSSHIPEERLEGVQEVVHQQAESAERPAFRLDYWGIILFIVGAPVIVAGLITQISTLGFIGLSFIAFAAVSVIASIVARWL